jgi:lipopolysaccharide biosynthesis glycosyltransferase
MTIPIVLACDDAYSMPLATTLLSIVESNQTKWPLSLYILSDNISPTSKSRITHSLPENSFIIEWHEIELASFRNFPTISHISTATYARFLIQDILPKHHGKILFLDTDILVLSDLLPLMTVDLQGHILAAVSDANDILLKRGMGQPGVPKVQNYFNAGVLLIDLVLWRQERIPQKALEYLEKHPHSPYSDQDALNVACDGKWKPLDTRWNFHDRHFTVNLASLSASEKPAIVHFVTSQKPWKPNSLSINFKFYDEFRCRTRFARNSLDILNDFAITLYTRFKKILKKSF